MPSLISAIPTVFENDLYVGSVQAGVSCLRVATDRGEFERGVLSVTLTIWCKATEQYYGKDRNRPELIVGAEHLPPTMAAAVRFLEILDIGAFVPETAPFYTSDFGRDLAAFGAKAGGVPDDIIEQIMAEMPPKDTKVPGLPYNEPMRPDLFFLEFRERFIEDARKQLAGLVDD